MDMIYIIFLIFLCGAVLTYFAGKINNVLQDILFLVSILVPAWLFFAYVDQEHVVNPNMGGIQLSLGLNALGWLFALIVFGLGIMAAIYAVKFMQNKERRGYFYFNFILTIMAMTGILISRDLVSFFIFWEIMTWSSYLMTIYNGKDVQTVGIKYFVFSAIGAYAMLMAIVVIHSINGSFMIDDLIRYR